MIEDSQDRLNIIWGYKVFTETLLSKKQQDAHLRSLCEIAELEFLARLPRGISKIKVASYIKKIGQQLGLFYDAPYLADRWAKLFAEDAKRSISEVSSDIYKRDKKKCQYCERIDNLEIHHVIPQDKKRFRGFDSYHNLVLACDRCNKVILNSIVLPNNWWDLHPDSRFSPK